MRPLEDAEIPVFPALGRRIAEESKDAAVDLRKAGGWLTSPLRGRGRWRHLLGAVGLRRRDYLLQLFLKFQPLSLGSRQVAQRRRCAAQ